MRLDEAWCIGEGASTAPCEPRLLDRVREARRLRHYSQRTEGASVGWIRRYILFHGKRHPADMGADEVSRFLSCLTSTGRSAPRRRSRLADGWAGGGGGSAGAEAGGTSRAIPCRGSQANTHGAGAMGRGEATGMTRRSARIGLGVLGIRLRAWSGFGRYTELSITR